jgi:adenosylcobinamide amidohydrolase
VVAERPLHLLGSAVIGGGLTRARQVLNMRVPRDYACPNAKEDLRRYARGLGVRGRFVGLMTAAMTENAGIVGLSEEGVGALAVVTVGVSHLTAAGDSPVCTARVGTINIIVVTDIVLTPSALVNAVMTITEAKTIALRKQDLRTSEGRVATGTATDAVVVGTTGEGLLHKWAGPVTRHGWLMARAVRAAIAASLEARPPARDEERQ